VLAVLFSLAFNVFVGVALLEGYMQTEYVDSLETLVASTVSTAVKLSFVVGLVIAFYFGTKK
jgi:hypothetical protein